MAPRFPSTNYRPARRLVGALKAGAALANATPAFETISVAGKSFIRVRFKATVGGTLSVHFLGPDHDEEANSLGTEYTTGNATDVTVTANTEAVIPGPGDTTACYGESFAKITFTPSGSGTINFADVSTL